MARFEFDASASDGFAAQILALDNADEIAEKVLGAAAPKMVETLKKHVRKHRRTGSMENSIKAAKIKKMKKGGYMLSVRPTGKSQYQMDDKGVKRKRREPVRNMEILAYLEYGTSHIPKEPIIENAVRECRTECENLMQAEFDRIVQEGGG